MSRIFRNKYAKPTAKTAAHPAGDSNYQAREASLIESLDELAFFQEFKADLLPAFQELIRSGAPTKEVLLKAKAMAAARLATIAVTEADSRVALGAIKELLDRTEGKVVEKSEVTHAMAGLKDEELDALVLTGIKELGDGKKE